jgi:hypothetical protein
MAWIAETGTGASAQAFTGSFIVAGSELALKPPPTPWSPATGLSRWGEEKDGASQNEHD